MYKKFVTTIGFFDGVHLGHQYLIRTTRKLAFESGYLSSIMTFDKILKVRNNFICTLEQKIKLLKSFSLDKIELLNFNRIKNFSADVFFNKYIVKKNIKVIVVGEDFRFGKDAYADVGALINLGKKYNISIVIIDDVTVNVNRQQISISSSLIRKKIRDGEIEIVNKFLGRKYYIEGEVIKGYGLASKVLEVPTLNIQTNDNLVLPQGVFFGFTDIKNKIYRSIANFGYSPTFQKKSFSIEIHILNKRINFSKGKLKFYPLVKIRDEKFFHNPDLLKTQILKDIEYAKSIKIKGGSNAEKYS
ncbi:MAG: riboflavin biosynthesis protein RibF [Endomicrobia bacterium]|nr:riboflavin biosynthesis protein RibF [Endomicrobiia bacterium]